MNILIVGSEGFIGSHLAAYYSGIGDVVYAADILEAGQQRANYFRISRLSPEYDELLQLGHFDFCVNCAGSSSVPYSMSHPVLDFEANCLDTIRILDGIKKYQPNCKYLHISSAAVYGNPFRLPVSETDVTSPISPYGWHKLIAENICKEYHLNFGLAIAIVRPFSVYGPGLKRQFFWDLYSKINATKDKHITLFGTGNESRDFIYIDDLVAAFDLIYQKGNFDATVYNIACGNEVRMQKAAWLFNELAGNLVEIEFNRQTRAGDPLNWRADVTRLVDLKFIPRYQLRDGLTNTLNWMHDHFNR